MDKNEKKAINKALEEEQLRMEKEFHKTAIGKIVRFILIFNCIYMAIGLILLFVCKIRTINLNQTVLTFADDCIKYSGISSSILVLIYCIFLPWWWKHKKNKKNIL